MTLQERIEDWLKRHRNPQEKEKHLLAEARVLLEKSQHHIGEANKMVDHTEV